MIEMIKNSAISFHIRVDIQLNNQEDRIIITEDIIKK